MLSQFRLPSLHSRVDDHLHPMTHNNSIEFQPSRSDDNRIHAPNPMERISAKRMRCPNCDLPAIAPMVSTYLRECIVENDWVCSACGFEWSSGFNGLLV
jgi:rubredoxin